MEKEAKEPDVDVDEHKKDPPDQPDSFKFRGYWWYWDSRSSPRAKGQPLWTMYPDHVSVMIERHYYT